MFLKLKTNIITILTRAWTSGSCFKLHCGLFRCLPGSHGSFEINNYICLAQRNVSVLTCVDAKIIVTSKVQGLVIIVTCIKTSVSLCITQWSTSQSNGLLPNFNYFSEPMQNEMDLLTIKTSISTDCRTYFIYIKFNKGVGVYVCLCNSFEILFEFCREGLRSCDCFLGSPQSRGKCDCITTFALTINKTITF